MNKTYTIFIKSENRPGVLYRLAGIFVRRKVNVESLEVHETAVKGISQFRIVIESPENLLKKILGSLSKIIEVKEINYK